MPGSLFTRTADGIVNDRGGQWSACTVDEQSVFTDHAAFLLLSLFDGVGREVFFDKLPRLRREGCGP
jgi:hypothetical protein